MEHVSAEHLQKNTEELENNIDQSEEIAPEYDEETMQDDVMITSENEDSQQSDSDSENWEYIMSDDSE